MTIRRDYKRIPVGEQIRHLVILRDDPVDPSGLDKDIRQLGFLTVLAQNPAMMDCGGNRWQKLKIWFSGAEWVAELEALEDKGGG